MTLLSTIDRWRKARIVRRAVRQLPEFDIPWAVIRSDGERPDGWDYHLIRAEWGYETAVKYQKELGGWILTL